MKRFIKIENNMIIAERYDSLNRIVEGEIEADQSHGSVGQVYLNGLWVDEIETLSNDEILVALLEAEGVL